jgi:myosin heavy subunit
MITSSNRHRVTNTINRMQSAAEQFCAYDMGRQFHTGEIMAEMDRWSNLKAREFDGQFKELALALGYRLQKSEAPERNEEDLLKEVAMLRDELASLRKSRDAYVASDKALEDRNAEVKRLRSVIERLGSHEAFHVATPDIPEELCMRMEFAREALGGTDA